LLRERPLCGRPGLRGTLSPMTPLSERGNSKGDSAPSRGASPPFNPLSERGSWGGASPPSTPFPRGGHGGGFAPFNPRSERESWGGLRPPLKGGSPPFTRHKVFYNFLKGISKGYQNKIYF
jgi:hypothetical protein